MGDTKTSQKSRTWYVGGQGGSSFRGPHRPSVSVHSSTAPYVPSTEEGYVKGKTNIREIIVSNVRGRP